MQKEEKILVNLIHASDLHFGDFDTIMDAQSPWWWQFHHCFDGYLGHTKNALLRLSNFYFDILDSHKNVYVIVTGDLTSTGSISQFNNASKYLENYIDTDSDSCFGLQVPPDRLIVVPGNHDYWPGDGSLKSIIYGKPTSGFHDMFPNAMPIVREVDVGDGRKLVLVCLDSNIDASKTQRLFARGSFVSQCSRLCEQLGDRSKSKYEIRILLMHHSNICSKFLLNIDKESKIALSDLIKKTGIQLVLTGHHHSFCLNWQETDCREVRCGTSTARDFYQKRWLYARASQALRLRKLERNSIILHNILEHDSKLWWQTTIYEREKNNPAGKFEIIGLQKRFPLLS